MRRAVAVLVLVTAGLAVLNALYQNGWVRLNYPSRERFPVRGIDVSHHQGAVEWLAVRGAGIEFAFIKASEGADHRDREFDRNWRYAQQAGIARGAYHFFTFCTGGLAQARNFIAAVGSSFGELPPVADVEFSGNCSQWESVDRIRAELQVFLARVEDAAQTRPVLYFTADAHKRILSGHFEAYPVWPRNVFSQPSSRVRPWLFWQFADNGRVPGVRTLVDLNVFRGRRAEFESIIRLASEVGV